MRVGVLYPCHPCSRTAGSPLSSFATACMRGPLKPAVNRPSALRLLASARGQVTPVPGGLARFCAGRGNAAASPGWWVEADWRWARRPPRFKVVCTHLKISWTDLRGHDWPEARCNAPPRNTMIDAVSPPPPPPFPVANTALTLASCIALARPLRYRKSRVGVSTKLCVRPLAGLQGAGSQLHAQKKESLGHGA